MKILHAASRNNRSEHTNGRTDATLNTNEVLHADARKRVIG